MRTKEKFEADLKKRIKKLQRHWDQIKKVVSSSFLPSAWVLHCRRSSLHQLLSLEDAVQSKSSEGNMLLQVIQNRRLRGGDDKKKIQEVDDALPLLVSSKGRLLHHPVAAVAGVVDLEEGGGERVGGGEAADDREGGERARGVSGTSAGVLDADAASNASSGLMREEGGA
ncbi:hypothetical protein ZWY2020_039890 [Hordeum vulgare]|nr:hypothetical protein ZWY2020_039890 [Hordeum vulgare]